MAAECALLSGGAERYGGAVAAAVEGVGTSGAEWGPHPGAEEGEIEDGGDAEERVGERDAILNREKRLPGITVQNPMQSEKDTGHEVPTSIKLYRRRWLILAIFVSFSASNAMQWIQYSIITNVVTKYYSVDSIAVDWTSMIYMITYIPFIFPASWLIEKKVSFFFAFFPARRVSVAGDQSFELRAAR
ncbi:hypothetical protein J437_LFUL004679 [Ladona fulva]|uniref:Uncharacterized protein n=1 Tax=Ladona fulva TaxID=123851 RepID=A0A8K0KRK7_LADFU|nr:hypothetical protein J437_LFUL004679 [Ladona fulva]